MKYSNVSIPYGLTLLSNPMPNLPTYGFVSIPYGLTLLSNEILNEQIKKEFQSPMD